MAEGIAEDASSSTALGLAWAGPLFRNARVQHLFASHRKLPLAARRLALGLGRHGGLHFRHLVPGPGTWVVPEDLQRISRDLGFPAEFRSAATLSLAARFRVAHREARTSGGFHRRSSLSRLDALQEQSPFLLRKARWSQWFRAPLLGAVASAVATLAGQGITLRTVEDFLAGGTPRPWPPEVALRVDCGTQRAVTAMLCAA